MERLLEKLSTTASQAKPYWRWIVAGILFLITLLAGYVIWRKLERLRQLENDHKVLKEKITHQQAEAKLVSNNIKRALMASEIRKLEGELLVSEKDIEGIKKETENLQASIAKAKNWKDLEG